MNKLFLGLPAIDVNHVYDSCSEIWPKLENSKILVMGGTGFIGRWIVASLGFAQLAGHAIDITVMSRNPSAHLEEFESEGFKTSWLDHDVSKNEKLEIQEFDHVINGATPSSAKSGAVDPKYVYDSIVLGNSSILNSSRNMNLRYLFLSSGAVTQLENSEPKFNRKLCEFEHLESLSTAYAHGKRFAEIDITGAIKSKKLNAQSLRLYAFAGPGLPLDQHFAAGNFMLNYLKSEPIEVKGNPNTKRSYMYPADLAMHIIRSLTSNETETMEIGSTEIVSMSEFAALVSDGNAASQPTDGDLAQPSSSYFPTADILLSQTINLDMGIIKWKEWLASLKN